MGPLETNGSEISINIYIPSFHKSIGKYALQSMVLNIMHLTEIMRDYKLLTWLYTYLLTADTQVNMLPAPGDLVSRPQLSMDKKQYWGGGY